MNVRSIVESKVLLGRENSSDVRPITVVRQHLAVSTTLIHAGPHLPITPKEGTFILGIGTFVLLVIGYDAYRKAMG
jgi:hypothetical protein